MLDQAGPDPRTVAELLVAESPDALFALALDGRVLSWNPGAEVIFGYTPAEAIGQLIQELIVPPDRQVEVRQGLIDVRDGPILFESVRRRKDGSLIEVDVSKRLVQREGVDPFIAVS